MSVYSCTVCKFRYDEWLGDTKNGVPPGVPFPHLAGSVCTTCGMKGEERHQPLAETKYAGLEATYYDQFAGKAGIAFYRDWLLQENEKGAVSVLELGVGTGRIVIELARNDLPTCGVDWSQDMLELAEKKKRRMLKKKEELLELIEQDIHQLELGRRFSHVLVPEGLFQQATCRDEQRKLLGRINAHLAEDGVVAIDLLLPPLQEKWSFLQRKFVFPDRMVYQRVEGETSLSRQQFRYTLTYETFLEQMEQPRYRVDRELAFLMPGELQLLLESEGFHIINSFENVPRSQQKAVEQPADGYDMDRWQYGGYPFAEMAAAGTATRWTLIAKK
ncbi:methyltransferase domain-containing protein [Brevibacillus reuszeri]|uniref:methyltransferase domain-containing protein n=1 Tax=Brevibacillus reuszeri TaxID=54915 RepID=UPI002897C3B4|nr:methyltransferase domain-containing protein [Brevibacillus reuszeri]